MYYHKKIIIYILFSFFLIIIKADMRSMSGVEKNVRCGHDCAVLVIYEQKCKQIFNKYVILVPTSAGAFKKSFYSVFFSRRFIFLLV